MHTMKAFSHRSSAAPLAIALLLEWGCFPAREIDIDGRDAGNSDAGDGVDVDAGNGDDAGQSDAGPTVEVVFELTNTSSGPVFLNGSHSHACPSPYVRVEKDGEALFHDPPVLTCRCDRCETAAGCQGLADAGLGFLQIPAGGVVRIVWDGRSYASIDQCTPFGCLQGTSAGDGPFSLVVAYRRNTLACPEGDPIENDLRAPEGDGTLYVCEFGPGSRCLSNTELLDQTASTSFRASDGIVRLALP